MTIDVTKIEQICNDFNWNSTAIIAKKKSLQSSKTKLNKNKFQPDYENKLNSLLVQIDALNQALNYMNPKEKVVTMFEQADVNKLDFDQTMKAIKSIQSAICNCRYETESIDDNLKYQKYKSIEAMLLEHKATVKPVDEAYIRKTELEAVIDAIKTATDATVEEIIKKLEDLL